MTSDPKTKDRRAPRGLLPGLIAGAVIALGTYAMIAPARTGPAELAPVAPAALTPSLEPGAVRLADPQQRSRIAVTEALADPVPLSAAMPARLIPDENVTARLTVPVDGRVVRLLHGIGDSVKAGEALAEIDAPDLASAIADASRAANEARFKRAAGQRTEELYSAGVVARKELEATRLEIDNAAAELTRARLRLRSLNAAAAVRGEYFVLSSPVGGTVTERNATLGQQVRADSGTPLMVVTDPARLVLSIDTPEDVAAQLRPGMTVRFVVDAFPGETFDAQLVRVGPQVDPATRRVPVRAAVANDALRLRPEMFARAWVAAADAAHGVRIPSSALLTTRGKPVLFVQREAGIFERREVTIAAQQSDAAWLRAGVQSGEKVVSAGALLLESEMTGH